MGAEHELLYEIHPKFNLISVYLRKNERLTLIVNAGCHPRAITQINKFTLEFILAPGLICRDTRPILKFRLAPIFPSKKIKINLKQELKHTGPEGEFLNRDQPHSELVTFS